MTQQGYFRKINRLKQLDNEHLSKITKWQKQNFAPSVPPIWKLFWKFKKYPVPPIYWKKRNYILAFSGYLLLIIGFIVSFMDFISGNRLLVFKWYFHAVIIPFLLVLSVYMVFANKKSRERIGMSREEL